MTRRENGLMSREVRDSEVARDGVADLSLAGEAKNGNDDKYRVPTHDEMSQFKEAEDMWEDDELWWPQNSSSTSKVVSALSAVWLVVPCLTRVSSNLKRFLWMKV